MEANGRDEFIIEVLRHRCSEDDAWAAEVNTGSFKHRFARAPGAECLTVAKRLLPQDDKLRCHRWE